MKKSTIGLIGLVGIALGIGLDESIRAAFDMAVTNGVKAADFAAVEAITFPTASQNTASVELTGRPKIIVAGATHLVPIRLKTREGKTLIGDALVIVTKGEVAQRAQNPEGYFVKTFAFPVIKAPQGGCESGYHPVFDTGYCQVPDNVAEVPGPLPSGS